MSIRPTSSDIILPKPDLVGFSHSKPETVDCSAVSLFKSRCFKIAGTAVFLAVTVTWILPKTLTYLFNEHSSIQVGSSIITTHSELTVNPGVFKALLGTILVGVAYLGLKLKKEIVYEISTLYTIFGSHPWRTAPNSWWSIINDYIVLGALPLEHQIDKLKKLGITHVIAMIEPFEFEPGIVQPVQSRQWKKNGIGFKHIETPDFLGVPEAKIDEALKYIEAERRKNPNAKFYIHCKAGRGRSAAIVLCDLMQDHKTDGYTKEQAYAHLKTLRHINLNKNQMVAVQNYLDSDFFKT
jgi:atypical dual specificity phosphatase